MSTAKPEFEPRDPGFQDKVRTSFARQRIMDTLSAELTTVAPGKVTIQMPFNQAMTQQHGFLHAGIIGTIADSACGYAAFSLMPAGAAVLSVEYKLNLLAPAEGQDFVATGQVLKSGRTLTVCNAEVEAITEAGRKLIASMTATMMTITGRGIRD